MQEIRNELFILETFLDNQKIERKSKDFVFRVVSENIFQQIRRDTFSVYQVILYENYILIEFLREYYEWENLDKICSEIENSINYLLNKNRKE